MSNVVTKYTLRKQLKKVNNNIKSDRNVNAVSYKNESSVSLKEKKIVKIKGNTVISDDGIEANLYSPLPCLHWKCTTTPNSNGVTTLKKSINGLFITEENNSVSYCIGIDGSSDEFELRLQIGTEEVRMNKNFLSIIIKHLIINGLEVNKQNE